MDYLIGATLGAMLLLLFAGISTHKDEEKSQAPSNEDESDCQSLREENARLKKELSELEESHSFTIALFESALIFVISSGEGAFISSSRCSVNAYKSA